MTDEYPKVPVQHEVARSAVRWVEARLPAAWVVHKPSEGDDYGTDVRIEIATLGQLTGRQLVVQVKGTGDEGELRRVRIARATINYLRGLTDPAIILRVCPNANRVRAVSIDDPRFDDESADSVTLYDQDAVPAELLSETLDRFSCRGLILRGSAPLVVGMEDEVPVRRHELMYGGRLDRLVRFEVDGTSPWQQYSSRHAQDVDRVRLRNKLPPHEDLDIPLTASPTELMTANVVFMAALGFERSAALMLLRCADLLRDKLVNPDDLLSLAVRCLSSQEFTSLLKIAVRNRTWWAAKWMLMSIKSGIELGLTKEEVDAGFDAQLQYQAFPELLLRKAQVLLSIGENESAAQAVESAHSAGDLSSPALLYEASDVLARAGRSAECIAMLREASAKAKDPGPYALELAKYLVMLEQYVEADDVISTLVQPQGDPLRSLFALCRWVASTAKLLVSDEGAQGGRLKLAWESARKAIGQRTEPAHWAETAILLGLTEQPVAHEVSHAALFYSAIFFGGDVARLILEHPSAENLSKEAVENLTGLAAILDRYRGGSVAMSAVDGEVAVLRAVPE